MRRPPLLQRLLRLIEQSISPYADGISVSLTKEEEKKLLVALSQVLREVELLKNEYSENSGMEVGETMDKTAVSITGSSSHSESHQCIAMITGELVILLASKSLYIQHVAANILVNIAELMLRSGINWDEFVQSLCLCLEITLLNIPPSFSMHLVTEFISLDSEQSSLVTLLKPRLEHVNWSCMSELIRVLKCILKFLKQEFGFQYLRLYLDSVTFCLSRVPWDLFNDILLSEEVEAPGPHNQIIVRSSQSLSRVKFLGNFVQFLCSLVEQCGLKDASAGLPDVPPVIGIIDNLVPKLFIWCLGKAASQSSMCIFQYFRHKLMMLLIRLSFQVTLEFSVLSSWLQLVHNYFQDLLLQPITQPESEENDCLEESPLLMSFFDAKKQSMSSRHLQRLTIFFFLRCTFSLVGMVETTGDQCVCACPNACLNFKCFHGNKGLLELSEWLQNHLPADVFLDHDLYYERCVNFTSSLLQLYMYEDDILFKMLMQLFSFPFCDKQRVFGERWTSQALNNNILLVQDLFNPIHLFHLFLIELHYDHQVLLDYLISKDTGASFAEYLLRCLRGVCDSWNAFVKFFVAGKLVSRSAFINRKYNEDDVYFQEELFSAPSESNRILPSDDKKQKRKYRSSSHCKTRKMPFEYARDCLLSLKKSLENLHQKNLFPYNPKVLLQRLTRFEELCCE